MEEELEKDMKPKLIEDLGMRKFTENSKEHRFGRFEDINPYWTITKYEGIESVKQQLEEKVTK